MGNGIKAREFSAVFAAEIPASIQKTFSLGEERTAVLLLGEGVSFRKYAAYAPVKRILDMLLSAVLLLLLALPLFLIAVWIRCDSYGPAIFRQTRTGRDLSSFTVYKFRTMTVRAPECASRELSETYRARYLTRIGRFLRRTGIDELPQLWNVLRGEMSLVGPRPVILGEAHLTELRTLLGASHLRPGITGLAQVSGRDDRTAEEKAMLDAVYARTLSFRGDVRILLRTVASVIRGTGCN